MDISAYEEILTKRMVIWGWVFAAMAVAFAIGIWWNYRSSAGTSQEDRESKILHYVTYLLCAGGLSISAFLGVDTISDCSYDINHRAYIVWEGDFAVYQDGPGKSRWYLPDEEGIKIEGEDLSEGTYTGKIIYGEKSKVVLDFYIDEVEK